MGRARRRRYRPPGGVPDRMSERAHSIVVADDDDDILALLALQLERLGYTVLTAADGEAALELVHRERPALLVVDSMMPRLDGHGVIRRLRAEEATASLPVILVSARAQRADADAGLGAGADVYIAKPFRGAELAAAVRTLLG